MRSRIAVLLAAALALCAGCGGGGSSGAGDNPPAQSIDFSQVGAKLDSFVINGDIPGYSFVLFDANGVTYTRFGGTVPALATPFLIASASKVPSAAAILTLVDEGKLDLDKPVVDYIGTSIDWPAAKSAITMRMLLSHTASLDPQPACLEDVSTKTLQECAQEIANAPLAPLPLLSTPGSNFNYGGGSYQIAGYVATLISQQSWQDFFNARIGTPLGLNSFTYGGGSNPRIAGGAMSNVVDEARIMRMVLAHGVINGKRVLSEAMVNELLRDQTADIPPLFRFGPVDNALYPGYTLGFFISDPSLHPGSVGPEFGDPGLYGATPWIDVGSDYGAVLLINKDTQTGLDIWNAVRPLILQKLVVP